MNKKERSIIFKDLNGNVFFICLTLLFIIIECLLNIYKEKISEFLKNYIIFKEIYNNLNKDTLLSTQVTVAALMLSVVAIMACNINDRCLNISYKRIFFKSFIYKTNYITLAVKMLICILFGLIEYLFGLRIMLFFTLFSTTVFLIQLMEMTYVMISKKSLIYIRLYNAIKTNNMVLEICIEKVRDWNIVKNDTKHNQYIIQELALLQLIEEKSKNQEDKNICKKRAAELMNDEVIYLNNLKSKIEKTNLYDNDEDIKKIQKWINKIYAPFDLYNNK